MKGFAEDLFGLKVKEGEAATLSNGRQFASQRRKEEGGLGICDMRTMNKAFTMKLVRGLLQKSDSLWIPYVTMGEGISQLQAKRTVETVEEGEAASTYCR